MIELLGIAVQARRFHGKGGDGKRRQFHELARLHIDGHGQRALRVRFQENGQDAIAIHAPELPLRAGVLPLLPGLNMPGCIRDASPDAWGRRVLIHRQLGIKGRDAAPIELDELSCLLESGSDRIGALDFQQSATRYAPRNTQQAALEELLILLCH